MIKFIKTEAGICTGRNGTVDIKGIEVAVIHAARSDGALFRIDCVSKARGVSLNAGFSMDTECARGLRDELARLVAKIDRGEKV